MDNHGEEHGTWNNSLNYGVVKTLKPDLRFFWSGPAGGYVCGPKNKLFRKKSSKQLPSLYFFLSFVFEFLIFF